MPYVMVPVPEEHVEDVMQFILRAVSRASMEPWDEASIGVLYGEIDEVSRSLLAFVAREASDGGELDAAEAARRIQMSVREVTGILNEFNTVFREENRPALITARTVTERLPNGRTKERRVLSMELEVAELVRAAEHAELARAQDTPGGPGQAAG